MPASIPYSYSSRSNILVLSRWKPTVCGVINCERECHACNSAFRTRPLFRSCHNAFTCGNYAPPDVSGQVTSFGAVYESKVWNGLVIQPIIDTFRNKKEGSYARRTAPATDLLLPRR